MTCKGHGRRRSWKKNDMTKDGHVTGKSWQVKLLAGEGRGYTFQEAIFDTINNNKE